MEDIKNLKEIVDLCEKEIKNNDDNTTAILDIADLKSLKNILNELDRLQKENTCLKKEIDEAYNYVIGYENLKEENEELKEQVNMFDVAYSGVINESKKWFDTAHDSIPKQVIRDKIEELKEEKYVSQSDDYDYIYNKGRHEVLKELLGE